MPETERDILELFKKLEAESGHQIKALIEKVNASPIQGAKRAFVFGKNYGLLRMALIAAHIPFEDIAPAQWQLIMRCRTGGNKNVSKTKAQELFPDLKITHDIADALLIAECLRRRETGTMFNRDNMTEEVKAIRKSIVKVNPVIFDL